MNQIQQLEVQAKKSLSDKKYLEAKTALMQALEIMRTSQQQDFNVIGRLLNNIGFILREEGNFASAETYFQKALVIYHKIGNPNNPDIAITLQHLGRIAHIKGDYDKSWKCWTEALSIWKYLVLQEKKSGYIQYLASSIHALGEYFADTEQYSNARKNFEQALEMRELVLSPSHADIAENLANLGRLCYFLQDYQAACLYLKRAVPLYAAKLGSNHPEVKDLQWTLANSEKQYH